MENPIQAWINEDKTLSDLLVEIQSLNITVLEQAEVAFDKLCELYDLPKMPEDIEKYKAFFEEKGIEEPSSVFEEHALLKFLEPNNDPRGLVLTAVYHVKKGLRVDYEEIAEKEFGKNIPKDLQIGIRGTGIQGEVVFPTIENKSWIELGCVVNAKLSN
tara:strand:- start:1350 stop:1826 length:477 start_codon:yes stop_codon:yes gene_type:complete